VEYVAKFVVATQIQILYVTQILAGHALFESQFLIGELVCQLPIEFFVKKAMAGFKSH